jgi:hypothetical protein
VNFVSRRRPHHSGDRAGFVVGKKTLSVMLLVALTGCTVEEAPTIAHTHIGHTMTGWQDTPDKVGLLKIAEREAVILEDHMEFALVAKDVAGMKEHIRHLIHTLDPEQTTDGPGTGYGMRQAIELGFDHLKFGAESDDASENLKAFASKIEKSVALLIDNCNAAIQFANEIRSATSEEEVIILTTEMKNVVTELVHGSDSNGDGKVELGTDVMGFYPLRDSLNAMIAREQPTYEPVATRWLFGLFRLPDGKWAFKPKWSRDSSGGGGGGGGGSY